MYTWGYSPEFHLAHYYALHWLDRGQSDCLVWLTMPKWCSVKIYLFRGGSSFTWDGIPCSHELDWLFSDLTVLCNTHFVFNIVQIHTFTKFQFSNVEHIWKHDGYISLHKYFGVDANITQFIINLKWKAYNKRIYAMRFEMKKKEQACNTISL